MGNNRYLIKQALEEGLPTSESALTKMVGDTKAGRAYEIATNYGKPAVEAGAGLAKRIYGSIKNFASKEDKESTRSLGEISNALSITSPSTTSESHLTKASSISPDLIPGALQGAALSAINQYETNKQKKSGWGGLKKFVSPKSNTTGVGKAALDGALNAPAVRGVVQQYLPQNR
jgi:hypothetical protein